MPPSPPAFVSGDSFSMGVSMWRNRLRSPGKVLNNTRPETPASAQTCKTSSKVFRFMSGESLTSTALRGASVLRTSITWLTMRPSSAVHRIVWLTVGPDSMSTVRLTPLPPVAAKTSSGHFGFLVSTTRSAPKSLSLARRSGLVEVPTTNFAPMNLATCKPMMPTPELAPCTITLSPAFRRPLVTSALCSVLRPIGSVAACS